MHPLTRWRDRRRASEERAKRASRRWRGPDASRPRTSCGSSAWPGEAVRRCPAASHRPGCLRTCHVDRPQTVFRIAAMAAGSRCRTPSRARDRRCCACSRSAGRGWSDPARAPPRRAGSPCPGRPVRRHAGNNSRTRPGDRPAGKFRTRSFDPQHAIVAFRELAEFAHHDLTHRFTPFASACRRVIRPARAGTTSAGRRN